MAVTVRLFAAAREASGASVVQVAAGTVQQVCDAVVSSVDGDRRARLSAVFALSTLLSDGIGYRAADDAMLADGSVVDVLPPFAGG